MQILLMLICHISIKEAIKVILYLMPFILFTVVINIWTMGKMKAILVGIRLILVCNITYIFGNVTTTMQVANAIKQLLYPLEWFGINRNNITIMVSIAITFIPIIKNEITNIKYSLMAKGVAMGFMNQIKHINYIMVPLFNELFKKVGKIEDALKAKGYVEE